MRSLTGISLLIILFLISSGNAIYAQSTLVSNKSELDAALLTAGPGDTVILKDQAWVGITMEINCMGAEGDSVVIRSETPGGASLEGGSRMTIGGDYVVIDGFLITNGYNSESAIVFNSGGRKATNCRLTNCMIDNWNPPDLATRFHWVVVYGENNRIDHCRFSNMNHSGVTVMVKAGSSQPGHHRIDHNFFGPKPEGDGNGYESIKMGGGDDSMFPLYSTVEYNYFYKCDGETELISNKSWENIYRYNTIYECQGTFTMRWGRKCHIEGNYFFGNGVKNTGGIRLSDQDHTVINNYFENIEGDDARAAISVMSGIPDIEGGNSGHGQTKNARILHNTIVGSSESLNVGYWDDDDLNDPRGDITAPENCTIANNIIYSSYGPLIKEDWAPSINTTWLGNILFGASAGIELDTGLILVDPGLVRSADGVMRLAEDSPAIDKAEGSFPEVLTDFEMQARDSMPDIGADEWSTAERQPLPIGEEDVGPDWYVPTTSYRAVARPDRSIMVYPNPASDRFYIGLSESFIGISFSVELIDLSGRKVLSQKFTPQSSDPEISTGELKGHYIVKISSNREIRYSSVILGK